MLPSAALNTMPWIVARSESTACLAEALAEAESSRDQLFERLLAFADDHDIGAGIEIRRRRDAADPVRR